MVDAVRNEAGMLVLGDSVLLVVDIQTRLLDVMPAVSAQAMLENTGKLLTAAGMLGLPVFLTEQYPKGLGPSADAVSCRLPDHTLRFEKTAFSCCGSEAFNRALLACGRRQVIVIGQETHVCVLQTAIDLHKQGFDVHVVEDAVCSRLDEHKHNALQRLRQLGLTVSNHESVLFEWLRDAKHGKFKAVSALLR